MRHRCGLMGQNRGKGSSREGLGGADSFPEHPCRSWSWQGSFREQMTCFNEHSCSLSQDSVSSVVDRSCMSFMASLTVSGASVVVWVLDMNLGVISWWVVAVVATIVGVMRQVMVGTQGANNPLTSHLDGEEGCAHASYVVVVVDKLKITKEQLVFEKERKEQLNT
jgi:hypothetical protein